MNAPANFTLPYGEQYLRLFGTTPPEQAITPIGPDPLWDDGQLGPPLHHFRDPNEGAAGQLLPFSSAAGGQTGPRNHPSAAALESIAALRLHHIAKGHSPESDAAHGPVFFMAAARAWWERAKGARSAEARRKAMVAAAAIFVAMIDAHDFTQQQEPTP